MNANVILICLLTLAFNVNAASSTEVAINKAREQIALSPKQAKLHIQLSEALAKRGRETANHDFYEQALQAANTALEIAPNNVAASRAKIWALLGKHEFPKAKSLADELNKRVPDDIQTYALLVDANVELGNYRQAEEAAQWLLDMRPGSIASLTRAAYLRELYGDLEGSALLLQQALEKTTDNDAEQQAWLLVHLSQIQMQLGHIGLAERISKHALSIYPKYHYALRTMVDIANRKQDATSALDFAKNFYAAAPHPENLFVLANALAQADQDRAAQKAFSTFVEEALSEADGWDNANRELVYFLVDEAKKPGEALRIAEQEYDRRQDIFTQTAYAWALSAAGRSDDAWQLISQTLAVGTKSPEIILRAGFIAHSAGKLAAAKQYLSKGAESLPLHRLADEARNTLSALATDASLAEHSG